MDEPKSPRSHRRSVWLLSYTEGERGVRFVWCCADASANVALRSMARRFSQTVRCAGSLACPRGIERTHLVGESYRLTAHPRVVDSAVTTTPDRIIRVPGVHQPVRLPRSAVAISGKAEHRSRTNANSESLVAHILTGVSSKRTCTWCLPGSSENSIRPWGLL